MSSLKFNDISEEEYLKFIDQVQDETYEFEDEYSPDEYVELSDTYCPKPEVKTPDNSSINATNIKRNRLLDVICKYTHIKVGIFTLRIDSYRSRPFDKNLSCSKCSASSR